LGCGLPAGQRWLAAGCFEALAEDLGSVLHLAAGHKVQATAAILDSRTLRSSPESGARARYDGAKRKKGAKLDTSKNPASGRVLTAKMPGCGDAA
jgi:hypothetical protein